jgi:hypothetical protein
VSIVFAEFHSSAVFLSILYWRPEMIRFKSTLNCVIVFSVLFGLVFFIGCGSSAEKQTMSDFLKLYSDSVNEYSAADKSKQAVMKGKLDSFPSKWSDMKMELDGQVTPQTLDEMDNEYKEITKKYTSSTG